MYRKCVTELSAQHQQMVTASLLALMQNFNFETMMTMMGNAPESAIKALNKQLNAFDLVE